MSTRFDFTALAVSFPPPGSHMVFLNEIYVFCVWVKEVIRGRLAVGLRQPNFFLFDSMLDVDISVCLFVGNVTRCSIEFHGSLTV